MYMANEKGANWDAVALLLESRAHSDVCDKRGTYLVNAAARDGRDEVLSVLIEGGVRLDPVINKSPSVFLALDGHHWSTVAMLLQNKAALDWEPVPEPQTER